MAVPGARWRASNRGATHPGYAYCIASARKSATISAASPRRPIGCHDRLCEPFGQAWPLDEGGRDETNRSDLSHFVHRHDVRMSESARQLLRLGAESVAASQESTVPLDAGSSSATCRRSTGSRASSTTPKPPRPNSRTISKRPSRCIARCPFSPAAHSTCSLSCARQSSIGGVSCWWILDVADRFPCCFAAILLDKPQAVVQLREFSQASGGSTAGKRSSASGRQRESKAQLFDHSFRAACDQNLRPDDPRGREANINAISVLDRCALGVAKPVARMAVRWVWN